MALHSNPVEVLGTQDGDYCRSFRCEIYPASRAAGVYPSHFWQRPNAQTIAALRAEGGERLKTNEFPKAVDLLARAIAAEPSDGPTRLQLGIALQGAGQHAQALTCFVSAQKLMPNDPAPYLHAAVVFLALNQPTLALRAASEACHRAPRLAQAHYTYGQALLACNEIAKAERAFAEAVRLMPNWPEAWINYGLARHRQGAIEDAKGAMQRALIHAPGHPAATAHLDAFTRVEGAQPEVGEQESTATSEEPGLVPTFELGLERYRLAPTPRRRRFSRGFAQRKRSRKRRPIRAIPDTADARDSLAFGLANWSRRWRYWKPHLRRRRPIPTRNCIMGWFCMQPAGMRRLRRYSDRARSYCRSIRRRI